MIFVLQYKPLFFVYTMFIVSRAQRYYTRLGLASIHLDNVHCTGDEDSLFDCRHNGVGIHDCGGNDDAGVFCYDGKVALALNQLRTHKYVQSLHKSIRI